jgi:alpha-1,6-mannosyltransferase
MKLCDVTQFYSQMGGGVKRYLQEKRSYIQNHTLHHHVAILPGEKDAVEKNDRLTIHWVKSPSIDAQAGYRLLWKMERIDEILAEEKPDLIESSDPYQVGWHLIKSGERLNIPVVGFYHSHFSETYIKPWMGVFISDYVKDYTIRLYKRFQRTLVPSPGLTARLQSWGIENAVTAKLGFDASVFFPTDDKNELRKKRNLPQDRRLLLYVGRMNSDKNFQCLLQATEKLIRNYPHRYHFIFIGDGALYSEFLKLHKKHPTEITHRSNPANLPDWYRAADLLVHPGIYETFGFSALESQACGTPVLGIISAQGFMQEHCCAGGANWAQENSPETFANAIENYRWDLLPAYSKECCEQVKKSYNWATIFTDNFKIYEDAILTTSS